MSKHTIAASRRLGTHLTSRNTWRSWMGLAFAAVLLASCGSSADEGSTSSSADATTSTAPEDGGSDRSIVTTDGDVAAGETAADDSSDEPTTTSPAPEDEESTTIEPEDAGNESAIPGEPLDFAPVAGTPLAIVGVAYDDTLNFRVDPSPDADIIESHGPLSDDLDTLAAGDAWSAPSGVWWHVEVGGTAAWANQAFLGSLGTPQSFFDEVSGELESLTFDTVEAAALAVADLRASDDPVSRIVFAGEPLAFDAGGFAIVDVLDLPDDSVKGERIRVDVQPVFDEASGEEGAQDIEAFVLVGVEITPICGRGLTDGLCT